MNLDALQDRLAKRKAEIEARRRAEDAEVENLQALVEAAAMDTILAEDNGYSHVRKSALGLVLARGQYVGDGTNDYRVAGHFGTDTAIRLTIAGMTPEVADVLTARVVDAVAESVRAYRRAQAGEAQPISEAEAAPKKASRSDDFRDAISEWVERQGSQHKAAKTLGIYSTTVCRWVSGKASPTASMVDHVARVTGIPLGVVRAASSPRGRPRKS